MNKLQIDCFLNVASLGSIARAAQEMFLSPQVVSQHIQNLEKEMGSVLFSRGKYGAVLTETGEAFRSYAMQWRSEYRNVCREMEEYYSSLAASFHIGISEYVNIMGNISSGIAAFRDQHPDVAMSGEQCKNKDLMKKVETGELDVAIINELQIITGGEMDYRAFAREDLRFYFSSDEMEVTGNAAAGAEKETAEKMTEGFSKEEIRHLCSSIPRVSTSYGVWNTSDWEEVSHRMSAFLGYDFHTHYETENFRSAILNLMALPCSVVCDARFGYIPDDADIPNIPIHVKSSLCCLWHRKNENPLIADFVSHLTEYYLD